DPSHWRTPNARLISLWTGAEKKHAAEIDAELAKVDKERAEAVKALVKKVLEHELAQEPPEIREKLREANDTPRSKRTAEQKELLKLHPRINVTPGNVTLFEPKAFNDLTKEFNQRAEKVRENRPTENLVQALTEVPGQVPTTHLFARGDIQQ